MRVVCYLRCSTPAQGEADKFGLDRQRALLDTWLLAHPEAVEVSEVRDIGHSGAKADRPGLAQVLGMVSDGMIDAVLVPCWDRFARDLTLTGYLRYTLQQKNVQLLSATEESATDPTSTMIQGILAAVAGFERSLITARLSGARKLKASRGGHGHGAPPFGYRADGRGNLEPDPAEQTTLDTMRYSRSTGMSYQAIAWQLTCLGVPTKNGGEWHAATVRNVLARESTWHNPDTQGAP
jgi:DNA invertase Pin-like site-specific DNA recombinase